MITGGAGFIGTNLCEYFLSKGYFVVCFDNFATGHKHNIAEFLTHENFKLLESEEFKVLDLKQCLYKGIEKATINHEKILADFFDLSLSQIDPISPDKHTFWVHDVDTPVIIYNNDELSIVKENIIDYAYNQMFNKTSTKLSPWVIINSNDKKIGRLNAMRYVISQINYDDKNPEHGKYYTEVVNVLK